MLGKLANAVEVWCRNHEIWVAVMLAAVFGFLFEVFSPRSMIGKGVSLLRNKLAERSAEKLKERIKKLAGEKEMFEKFIASDRALYLRVLRHLMVSVLFFGIGGFILIVAVIMASKPGVNPLTEVQGVAHIWVAVLYFEQIVFQLAVMAAWTGLRIAMMDSKDKLGKAAAKLELQIEELQEKLEKKTGAQPKPERKSAVVR